MRILIIYSDPHCSCTRKSTFELAKSLANLPVVADILFYTKLTEDHFKAYDILFFQRLGGNGGVIKSDFLNKTISWINKYRGKNKIIYNIDDLLMNNNIEEFIKQSDVIMVPNQSYDKHMVKYNKSIEYLRTFIDYEKIKEIKNTLNLPKEKLKLFWASTGLVGDSFMHDLIPEINKNFENCQIHILGSGSSNFNKYKNVITKNILPFEKFIEYFKACDIYLNPIDFNENNPRKTRDFINCKSEVKYLDCGINKIPIISSKSAPYEHAIKNRINGIILENDTQEWINAIKELKENESLRNKIIENAYLDASENYNLAKTGERIYNIFRKLSVKKIKENDIGICQLEHSETVGEIVKNRTILQKFRCDKDNLKGISILGATYKRDNLGTMTLHLLDAEEKLIQSQTYNISHIRDNTWIDFYFKPILDSCDKEFILKIESTANPLKAMTVYCLRKDVPVKNLEKLLIVHGSVRQNIPTYLTFKTYFS